MPRPDNLAVEGPAQSVPSPVESSTTSDELSDQAWTRGKYDNFRAFVATLVAQEGRLLGWSLWLDRLPMAAFLAGGDCELKGVRGASDSDKRAAEADLVLQRWALQYGFDLSRIFDADREKLRRYILLFSAC